MVQLFLWSLKNIFALLTPSGPQVISVWGFSNFPPSNLQNSSKPFKLSSLLQSAYVRKLLLKEPSIIRWLFSLYYFSCKTQWLELEIYFLVTSIFFLFFFFCSLFLHSDSKSLIALPESYLQESSPSRALRLLFSKKALLFPVISEANSRLGAKHASLLLRLSLSKHTERIWKVRSSDAEVRHFSYGTALKTL